MAAGGSQSESALLGAVPAAQRMHDGDQPHEFPLRPQPQVLPGALARNLKRVGQGVSAPVEAHGVRQCGCDPSGGAAANHVCSAALFV